MICAMATKKGWTELKDTALAEHALLTRKIRNLEQAGVRKIELYWSAWWIRQVANISVAYIGEDVIGGIITLTNKDFYKISSVLQDCINRSRNVS